MVKTRNVSTCCSVCWNSMRPKWVRGCGLRWNARQDSSGQGMGMASAAPESFSCNQTMWSSPNLLSKAVMICDSKILLFLWSSRWMLVIPSIFPYMLAINDWNSLCCDGVDLTSSSFQSFSGSILPLCKELGFEEDSRRWGRVVQLATTHCAHRRCVWRRVRGTRRSWNLRHLPGRARD